MIFWLRISLALLLSTTGSGALLKPLFTSVFMANLLSLPGPLSAA
jgi:hypothetical protein